MKNKSTTVPCSHFQLYQAGRNSELEAYFDKMHKVGYLWLLGHNLRETNSRSKSVVERTKQVDRDEECRAQFLSYMLDIRPDSIVPARTLVFCSSY